MIKMIKLLSIIKKNFKVLMRNKTSALILIVAPILIILLIGLAFNNVGSNYKLILGVHGSENNVATNTFIDGLEEQYDVVLFNDDSSCIESVKKGKTNVCLLFPKNLKLGDDEQDEIVLYVDDSRINLVDTVVSRISNIIGLNAESTSKDLTNSLLNVISLTKSEIESDMLNAITIKQKLEAVISSTDSANSDTSAMNLEAGNIDLDELKSDLNSFFESNDEIRNNSLTLINEINSLNLTGSDYSSFTSKLNSLESEIDSVSVTNSSDYDSFINSIDDTLDEITELESRLSSAKTKQENIKNKLNDIKSDLKVIKNNVIELKTSLEKINSAISDIKVFNAENIVNPISTTIKPLSTDSKSSMYLIPFLVVLIIMFIGIMLSGTSVLIDKMSSAAFRTFTAPTRDSFYLLSYYLTNVIILLVQIVLIGGLAKYFLNIELMNIPLILLIIFLAATLFIFIGMSFGYIFKSQEGVTIASLSFSALLLFVSNLIIPLESTSSLVQKISTYNPYVILSETLKKVLLYDIKIIDIVSELGIIVLYIILVVVLILIIQKLSKLIYFKKIPHIKKRKNELNPEQYFKLIDGRVLKSKQELLKFLESCDRDEFKEFVDHDMNKFVEWLKNTLKEKKLAKKLKNITNKKEFVNIIEEDVARGFRNKEFMFF